MIRKITAAATITIILNLTFPVKSFHRLDEMINTFNYLNSYTRIPIKDAFFLYTNISFIDDIHGYIASKEANFRLVTYRVLNENTKEKIRSFLQPSIPTITVLSDFDNSTDVQELFLDIEDSEDNIWLIQLSKNFVDKEELYYEVRNLISDESYYTSKLSLDSHVYMVGNINGRTQLFEIYQVCYNHSISIKWISYIPNNDISKHVWDNRKNLELCNIRVGYMDYGAMLANLTKDTLEHTRSKNQWLNTERLTLHTDGLIMYGFRVQLFKLLQSRLNFSIKWVNVEDSKFGEFDENTGNWNGIVEMIIRDLIDTSILDLSHTVQRDVVLSYTTAIQKYSAHLFFGKLDPSLSWSQFVDVFDVVYWCCIITSILAFTIFLYLISLFSIHPKYETFTKTKAMNRFLVGMSQCLRAFVALDTSEDDNYSGRLFRSKRLVMLVMCFCGILNLYVYNAGLISYLMVQKFDIPINSLGDILEKSEYKLLVFGGTTDATFLKYSYDPNYRSIWDKTIVEGGIVDSHEEAIEKLLSDRESVYFGISPEVELSTDAYPCQIMRSKMGYNFRDAAYAFKKNSTFIKVFDHQIHKIIEAGLDTEQHNTLNKKSECTESSAQMYRTISYKDIIFGFLILIVGTILAVSYLLLEHLFQRYSLESSKNFQDTKVRGNSSV